MIGFREILSLTTAIVLMTVSSCCGSAGKEESWQDLLAESDRLAALQQWEPATEYALKALSAGDLTGGGKSLALSRLASLDIMTWRDAQGWEHAVEAERIARQEGTDSLVSIALLQKGRLQLCGAITEGEAQDAQALETLQEALSLAAGSPNLQADILLQISQAFIGLNRFRPSVLHGDAEHGSVDIHRTGHGKACAVLLAIQKGDSGHTSCIYPPESV